MLTAGEKLSHYEIISAIGVGGMGEVYLAADTQLGRRVALKVLLDDVAGDPDRVKRFVQEAKAASALNHPNILTVYEIGESDHLRYIATELINGETLRSRLGNKSLTLRETLDIALQVAAALSAAHEAGIVHRDIKPENIMIRDDGLVKVLDFGLAKLVSRDPTYVDLDASTRFQTEPGTIAGTAVYMSPEQARGTECDARSDIFSLGIVIYEMVAGRQPFAGSTSGEVMASILGDKAPQPLARYASDVPAELERIVTKSLRKNRDNRYQTTKDMLLDLRHLKEELDFQRKAARSRPPDPPRSGDTDELDGAATFVEQSAYTTSESGQKSGFAFSRRVVVTAAVALIISVALAISGYFYASRTLSAPINSIAVLPFVNASGNVDTEYLSDGITESLINTISRLPHIKVMSRNSVFRYKGHETDATVVGRDLGVQRVLTGTVVQRGDVLSISIELINAGDNSQVWGQHYDRKLSDIFTTQNEITTDVSEKLRVPLSSEDQKRIGKRYTDNVEAYQLYMRGRFEANKFTPDGLQKAISYYDQAIAVDPTYALAYTGLADLYILKAHVWVPPKEGYTLAKASAEKAVQLDDTLAEAHAVLATVKLYADWNYPGAQSEYKRSIELNPNYSDGHSEYSCYFKALKQYPEEIAEAKLGQELDPLSAFSTMELGEAYYQARRYDDAIQQISRTFELDPHFFIAFHVRARAYEQKKMYAEAIADCQAWLKIFDDDPIALATLAHIYATMGKRREAEDIATKLLEMSKQQYFSPYWIAIVYAGLGDKDKAFEYFEKAFDDRFFLMTWINSDPRLDNIRPEPRFKELVKRMGLPE